MLNTIKKLFGVGPKVNFKILVEEGAIILDVRTREEFQSGHIKGALNIPVQNLSEKTNKLDTNKVVITCCASGMRSASAKSILKSKGYTNVHNGGSWVRLQSKLE